MNACLLKICKEAMDIWDIVYQWWGMGSVNCFIVGEMLNIVDCNINSSQGKIIWQSMVRVTSYFIWKNRNNRVFGRRFKSARVLFKKFRLRVLSGSQGE